MQTIGSQSKPADFLIGDNVLIDHETVGSKLKYHLSTVELFGCSMPAVAASWGVDVKRLRLALRRAKISFVAERELERRRRFEAALAENPQRLPAQKYSEICGFDEPSSFYAFFERWKGVRFSEWRAQNPAPANPVCADFAESVAKYLRRCDLAEESVEATARRFDITSAELIRFLEYAKTSWQKLVYEERKRRFKRAVKYFGLDEEKVFYQIECGYSDPQGFDAFIKRYKGVRFSTWRTRETEKNHAQVR